MGIGIEPHKLPPHEHAPVESIKQLFLTIFLFVDFVI